MKRFDNYLFRASSIGNIISKSGNITDSIMTYLNDIFIGEIFGVKKEAYGKALEKGITCEQDGFKMLNDIFYPNLFVKKEKEPVYNEYCKGTADTIPDEYVNDIKNAYDLYSFHKAELTWVYEWQLRTYMMLYNKQKARLFYCLNNMPEYMILEEQRRMFYTQKKWATMENNEFIEACEKLAEAHNYDKFPIEQKFKFWEIDRDFEKEKIIKESVLRSRYILNDMYSKYLILIEKNKEIINSHK